MMSDGGCYGQILPRPAGNSTYSGCSRTPEGLLNLLSQFTLSVWPLDWGWNPEDKLMVEPIRCPKAFQNLEVNWEPLSDTIS